jgi:hypothetical protein
MIDNGIRECLIKSLNNGFLEKGAGFHGDPDSQPRFSCGLSIIGLIDKMYMECTWNSLKVSLYEFQDTANANCGRAKRVSGRIGV